jgi:hypothetical protein
MMTRRSAMRRNILLVLLLIIAAAPVRPEEVLDSIGQQNQSLASLVRGLVAMELETKERIPLELVDVRLQSRGGKDLSVAYSDRDGMYYFQDIQAGEYLLSVEVPGRGRRRYQVRVLPGAVYDVAPVIVSARDYVSAFRDGVRLFDTKQWRGAALSMQEALRLQTSEQNRVRQVRIYGVRFEPYAPTFFLMAALTELGQCARAKELLPAVNREVSGTQLERRVGAVAERCG